MRGPQEVLMRIRGTEPILHGLLQLQLQGEGDKNQVWLKEKGLCKDTEVN